MQPNKRYVQITSANDNGFCGLSNEGIRGIGLKKDAGYRLTVTARNAGARSAANYFPLIHGGGEKTGFGAI